MDLICIDYRETDRQTLLVAYVLWRISYVRMFNEHSVCYYLKRDEHQSSTLLMFENITCYKIKALTCWSNMALHDTVDRPLRGGCKN